MGKPRGRNVERRPKGGSQMDHKQYMDALGVVARSSPSASGMEVVERHTRDYFQREIAAMQEGIEYILRDIKAASNIGGYWIAIEDYIKS
jgi:hypothetical protein